MAIFSLVNLFIMLFMCCCCIFWNGVYGLDSLKLEAGAILGYGAILWLYIFLEWSIWCYISLLFSVIYSFIRPCNPFIHLKQNRLGLHYGLHLCLWNHEALCLWSVLFLPAEFQFGCCFSFQNTGSCCCFFLVY